MAIDSEPTDREIRLEIKNYRCFPKSRPARFRLRPGITSLIGPNNAGKSTLLKFFYEFRDMFGKDLGEIQRAASQSTTFNFPVEITDKVEVAAKRGTGDIEVLIQADGYGDIRESINAPAAVRFRIQRGESNYSLEFADSSGSFRLR